MIKKKLSMIIIVGMKGHQDISTIKEEGEIPQKMSLQSKTVGEYN